MGRLAALGSILASLALIGGCGRVAAVRTNADSGPPEEGGSTGLPDARSDDENATVVEGGDNESGSVDATNDGSADEAGDAGALLSGDASASITARMNDVSILFPLPTSAGDVDNLLSPSRMGLGGPLFPSGVYASMGFIEGSTPVGVDAGVPLPPFVNFGSYNIAAYGDLRVVAMRIDPCFGSLDPDPSGAGCTAQLRLVLQEVRWVPDGGTAVFDSAIHAFYDLSRGQFLALARALVDLRVANANGDDLGSLAPHPIMVRQGLAGPMSQGVQRLILEYAGAQNLVRAAESSDTSETVDCSTGCQGFAGSWGMAAFDLNGASLAAISREIPTLATPDGGGVIAQGIGFGDFGTIVQPTTTSSDDYSAIYNASAVSVLPAGEASVLLSPKIQAALDALVRVENPRDNSPDTIDCASCHLATQTEQSSGHVASFNDTTSPLAYSPDGTIVARSDMQATFTLNAGFNIHAFSYLGPNAAGLGHFGSVPTISQRVVNETAAVVEYLNALPP
jgi:hypothetical protein